MFVGFREVIHISPQKKINFYLLCCFFATYICLTINNKTKMNTQKTANQICREKVDTICAQHGITLIFSGSGDYTDRAHATYTYNGAGIDLFIYPNGSYPWSKCHYYNVTAN